VPFAGPWLVTIARHLIAVDEAAVVANYEADILVNDICATHQIPLNRLYRILDHHQIPRRQATPRSCRKRLRRRILTDYVAGVRIEEIAHRYGVSHGTVSNIAAKHVLRKWHRSRDERVELVVRWFVGGDTTVEERRMIVRIGCRQPGLRSLDHVDPAIADDVVRRLAEVLRDRRLDGP
jgi:hypothetical protein